MKPTIWGKYMWMSIHLIALGYPNNPTQEVKNAYYSYFNELHKVIPCVACSNNYVRHIAEMPLTEQVLSSRNNLFDWTINLHNVVNKMLGKEVISKEHAYTIFTSQITKQNDAMTNAFRSLSSQNTTMYVARKICIIMNLMLILIAIWFLRKYLMNKKFI
jgi:hypothetical protein